MIRIGRREYFIPSWLEVVVPLAFGLYATLRQISAPYFGLGFPGGDGNYSSFIGEIATGAIAGSLLIDLVRRSVVTWYTLLLLLVLCWSATAVALLSFRLWNTVAPLLPFTFVVGAALTPRSVWPLSLSVGPAVSLLLSGIVIGLILALGMRTVAGLPLMRRDTLRDCGANVAAAIVWIVLGFCGSVAARSLAVHYSPTLSSWIALGIALAVVAAATLLRLLLVYRIQAEATAELASSRPWLATLLCIVILFYSPYAYGVAGVRLLYDYVRPALRAVHVLPTPTLSVAGYTVDVPFHDQRTRIIRQMPDGSPSEVSVPFPIGYGLTGSSHMHIDIRRRDVPPLLPGREAAVDVSKVLKGVQDGAPDRDAILVMSTPRYTRIAMRLIDYPDVDVVLSDFDRSESREMVEQAVRRFLHERVRRTN